MTTTRTTMMTRMKTTKTMMNYSAIMFLLYYYDHMHCTRSKLAEIPRCEPITSLG
jgi:hypothetical protein